MFASLNLVASLSRLHIVAIGATAALTFGWALTGAYVWPAVVFAALDWFLVNLLNRVTDLHEDQHNRIVGTDFVARHRRAIMVTGFGGLAVSLIITAWWLPALFALRACFHGLGFAYNWPLLPNRGRIKELYGAKNLASGTGFVLTCLAYPLALHPQLAADVTPVGLLLFGAFFLAFELSYEILYDLRDVDGDRVAGVRSFAVVHGISGSTTIIDGLIGLSLLLIIGGYIADQLPWRLLVMGIAPISQMFIYKRWLARGIAARDCINLTWLGAGLLGAYNVWWLLGLPGA